MSMRDKLMKAASFAAREAMMNERGRVLWLMSKVEEELEAKIDDKVMTPAQIHAAQVKLKLFKSAMASFRRAILSGVEPVEKVEEA